MSKQIPRNEEIYVAPKMLGKYEGGTPVVIDEKNNNERLDPTNIEHKIKIYEREVNEWFLVPATRLLEQDNFDYSFIVLMVCMSYLEGVEQYKTGIESNGRSKKCFVDSIKRLYPDKFQDEYLNTLYTKSRCGLFHNGMVKGGVIFNNSYAETIEFQNNGETIKINPKKLLNDIKEDFNNYIRELTAPNISESGERLRILRENFDRMFSVL